MNGPDSKNILLEVFQRLRRVGGNLGIGELLAAYQAVEGGRGGDDRASLQEVVALLWCKSPEEKAQVEEIFEAARSASRLAERDLEPDKPVAKVPPALTKLDETPAVAPPPAPPTGPPQQEAELAVLPVRALPTLPPTEAGAELHAYWPVSRRSMVYTWRYLRRPVKDGSRDILNLPATVAHITRQGFFLEPIYDRRESNHAHIVLLIDQGGSMVPFHRFTRDLVETARTESTIRQVDVVYFHNVPPERVFRDANLTESLPLSDALGGCSPDSSILLVSDAGAARGYRRMDRVRANAELLVRIKRLTTLIAWLNPVPQVRWAGTSAQYIAGLVPMFQMDTDGFSNAVDILRGQPLHPHR